MLNHLTPVSPTLVWFAKEFAFTVSLSFVILTTILWVLFDRCGPAATITHTRLFGLVVACSIAVFVFMAACTWLLLQLCPTWVTSGSQPEYQEGTELDIGLEGSSVGGFAKVIDRESKGEQTVKSVEGVCAV